ncbi:MAG: hypothetical protein WB950_18540, partial [Acidobacteriaceae bacterium]
MKLRLLLPRILFLSLLAAFVATGTAPVALSATIDAPRVNVHKKSRHLRATHSVHHKTAYRRSVHSSATVRRASYSYHRRHYRHRYYERFTASSYAQDQTAGDITAGENPVVRQAAISALGDM